MKKRRALFVLIPLIMLLGASLAGCALADYGIIHRSGNLIVTNYSEDAITDVTITSLNDLIAVSHQSISDTKVCYFTVDPKPEFTYTVSFVDCNGKKHSKTFVNSFAGGARVLIAINSLGGSYMIDYDK
ncbi:MAG: hypothetical protein HFE63_09785 [Clostridiales bacterium]|nr:hypothetical protein [Clostridiales bacterium]